MKISVCLATYNGEKFIEEQLRSILTQTINVDEIVISDDNSNDNTLKIIEGINSSKIKIYKNENNGIISNFENALSKASGDYIFLCDQDDIWHQEKVERVINQLDKCDLVVHDAEIVDKELNLIHESFFELSNSKEGFLRNIYKNKYLGCCMAFNKKILRKSLPIPNDIEMHDIWIGNIAALVGRVLFLDENLLKYRRHGENASPTSEKSKNSFKKKIVIRLNLIKNLAIFFIKSRGFR